MTFVKHAGSQLARNTLTRTLTRMKSFECRLRYNTPCPHDDPHKPIPVKPEMHISSGKRTQLMI